MAGTTLCKRVGMTLPAGILCQTWASWGPVFRQSAFDLRWIIVIDATWVSMVKRHFPDTLVLLASRVDWDRLDPVLIIGVTGLSLKSGLQPMDGTSVYIFDSAIRKTSEWQAWHFKSFPVYHNLVGGATDAHGRFTLVLHNDSKSTFTLSDCTLPEFPLATIGGILSCTVKGTALDAAPRLSPMDVPLVSFYNKRCLHPGGLFPWKRFGLNVIAKCVFVSSKYVHRQLDTSELLHLCDIPVTMHASLQGHDSQRVVDTLPLPLKCYNAISGAIFVNGAFSLNGGGFGISPSVENSSTQDTSSKTTQEYSGISNKQDSLPPGWISNTIHDKDEKATKSDDARVPVAFWNNALAVALGQTTLSVAQEVAIEKIRDFMVERVWKASITHDFCSYVRCKRCYTSKIRRMFSANSVGVYDNCRQCKKYLSKRKSMVGIDSSNDGIFKWGKDGLRQYKKLYSIFRQVGKHEARKELETDIMAARECFEKVFKASTWKWDGGSRPFFWRWGEFTKEARDGAGTFVQGELPRCTDKQSVPKDARTKALVQSKVADVRAKGYIGKGEDKVVSVTSFFDVPKGTDDIRMVYNATSSGLNGAVWAPWFSLPTVDSHLQAVDPGTFMGDCDISEMFLNFMLDKAIRPYAGVDLTRLFPNEAKDGSKRLWENWTRMLMGYKPSPYITTREICRQQPFLVGDRRDPQNVFRWSKVILNLPGKDNYNPARPRVYKVREDQTTIAADLFVYIDDVRNTAPSEVEGWKGAHQVCCRLGWLGIQDAARKRNYPSVTPRAWAGTIIHSDNNAVTVLVSEEKWGKTKDWINWVLERVNDKAGILHKELERCRGFLIYVSRTYTSFKPYLRGLHKTIDSWRPGRDDDGWKIGWEIMAAKERGDWELLNTQEPDEYVKPVKRLRQDFEALAKMTRAEAPPKVIKRRGKVGKAFYGFGDASGDGYGFALEVEGKLLTEFGTWKAGFENKHSNFKELFNLVNAVETAYAAGSLKGCELFIFTDNFVAESSYYNGGSNQNKELDDLVFRLWDIQMNGDFTLFIYHVAGTRMIQSGVDG